MRHEWIKWRELTCCKHCGIIRRRDGGNDDKECRGKVKIALRDTPEHGEADG